MIVSPLWTPENVELLKAGWKAGEHARVIAESIGGGATANAVVGKAHRLGLDPHANRAGYARTALQLQKAAGVVSGPTRPKVARASPTRLHAGARAACGYPARPSGARTGERVSYDCSCDYDPPEFCSSSVRKARKPHRCEECGNEIRPGDLYEYVSGKWDGWFSTFTTCDFCLDLRVWTENNLPCFCPVMGNMHEEMKAAIDHARWRAPEEMRGVKFAWYRRIIARDRFYKMRRAQ